ncbi:hypothetical protein NIES4071_79510 [Calothrix sp. NIES-4071]|nr:hypothetical protein NIES4071_79510 [Calothrix sp. NIES-4071]BAZ62221.1 hypothetical protein NIES4105_79440 [Calothrix sp. NIES-4105]
MVLLSGIFRDTPINTQEIPQKLLDIQDKQRSNPLPWKGQFSPQLIETLIKKYATSNSVIFDPFLGSGTVLYEAARFGIEAHGTDINPAALTLASVYKFTNIYQRQREIYTSKFIERLKAEIPDDTMPLFQGINIREDLAPDEIKQKLIKLVDNSEESLIKLLHKILVILLDFGNTELTSFRIFTLANTISTFIHKLPYTEKTVNAYNADSRNTPLTDGKVNLIITSPPYINVFNYHQQYRASTEALGWNLLEVAKSEFGSNRKHRANRFLTVIQYCLDMAATLQELLRICSTDSRMIFVVGRESNVRGTAFYNGEIVTEIAYQVFGIDLHTRQERKFTNRYGQIIKEDILHFKKPKAIDYNNINIQTAIIVAIKALEAANSLAINDVKSDIKDAITKADKVEPSPYYNPEKARK